MNQATLPVFMSETNAEYNELRNKQTRKVELLSLEEAKKRKPSLF
jgi:hypothetical protein